MNALDLVGSAVANTFRSKTRTVLTILAIFVGAFTLTLTNGLGTGINRYIDDTVASIGAAGVMTVTKSSDAAATSDDGPAEYDPDAITSAAAGPPGSTSTVSAITPDDLSTLEAVPGVERVEATRTVDADWIAQGDGARWVVGVGSLIPGQRVQLAAGAAPDADTDRLEVAIPVSYVEPLGFADDASAVGQTVTIAVSDPTGTQHEVAATVVGVADETFTGGGATALPNAALTTELFSLQNTGVPADQQDRFVSANVSFDPAASQADVDALKAALADEGFTGTTVADRLGAFTAVIDAIVLVLNAFAVIALLAASFGIVNTLLMSVQERTREIGLMKAMGMGGGRVFALFSLEAVVIGFFGSALGAIVAIVIGTGVSSVLADGLFADLPGLTVIAFDPLAIVGVILIVMAVAFLAGTLPAARAARADPVESLRYE